MASYSVPGATGKRTSTRTARYRQPRRARRRPSTRPTRGNTSPPPDRTTIALAIVEGPRQQDDDPAAEHHPPVGGVLVQLGRSAPAASGARPVRSLFLRRGSDDLSLIRGWQVRWPAQPAGS